MRKIIEGIKKPNPFLVIALSFLIMIIVGGTLLYMPFSLNNGIKVSYVDSIFTATTSLCVTGLISVKQGIADTYSVTGKLIIMLLIQIGGLGVTTFASIFFLLFMKKMDITHQNLIKESWSLTSYKEIRKVFYRIIILTFSIEFVGGILSTLIFYFGYNMNFVDAIFTGFFHSVSSFNNAGIDIIGTTSLINFNTDWLLLALTSVLIILGGLGYLVIIETFAKKFKFKRFSLHTKIVLTYTASLLIVGTLLIYLSELANSTTDINLLNSGFLSVSSRTAGFTSVNLSELGASTLLIIGILMFIGASSGSTGGGVKTTTFALFLVYFRSIITNKTPAIFKRTVSGSLIRRAMIIILLGITFFVTGFLLVCLFENNMIFILDGNRIPEYVEGSLIYNGVDYAFECMSAFGTVGLSTGITPYLSIGSKITLVALMYIGRVGPFTLSTMFRSKKTPLYRYVSEDCNVG